MGDPRAHHAFEKIEAHAQRVADWTKNNLPELNQIQFEKLALFSVGQSTDPVEDAKSIAEYIINLSGILEELADNQLNTVSQLGPMALRNSNDEQ